MLACETNIKKLAMKSKRTIPSLITENKTYKSRTNELENCKNTGKVSNMLGNSK